MGDLGVAAADGDPELPRRLVDRAEHRFDQGLGRLLFGEDDGGEEEAGGRSHGGDVVGVDVDGVPAGLVGGEGDRVGLGDHAAVPEADDGGVLADAGGNQQALVLPGGVAGEHAPEQLRGELAGGVALAVHRGFPA